MRDASDLPSNYPPRATGRTPLCDPPGKLSHYEGEDYRVEAVLGMENSSLGRPNLAHDSSSRKWLQQEVSERLDQALHGKLGMAQGRPRRGHRQGILERRALAVARTLPASDQRERYAGDSDCSRYANARVCTLSPPGRERSQR